MVELGLQYTVSITILAIIYLVLILLIYFTNIFTSNILISVLIGSIIVTLFVIYTLFSALTGWFIVGLVAADLMTLLATSSLETTTVISMAYCVAFIGTIITKYS